MPEDHLLEAKSVLQHAGKFYGMYSLPVMAGLLFLSSLMNVTAVFFILY